MPAAANSEILLEVGAIFVAIMARAELETGDTTPEAELPGEGHKNYLVIHLIWPIVTFLVVTSVHQSHQQ